MLVVTESFVSRVKMCTYVCWALVHACQRSADSGGGTTVVLGYSHPVMCGVVSGWKSTTAQILLGSEEEEYVFQVLFHMHLLANLLSKQSLFAVAWRFSGAHS